jgi:putative transposase
MGRSPRPIAPDTTYHLMARGNRRQPIFLQDDDRRTFLRMLSRVCLRYGWVCYAYCLMGNHIHLAIKTPEPNLSEGMRHLLGRYAWLHNQFHGTDDHLFRSRFRAVVIESDAQLISVIRYISRNPVRAELVERAEQWPWASYPALIGVARPLVFFDPAETLRLFDRSRWRARAALRGLVDDDNPRWELAPTDFLADT